MTESLRGLNEKTKSVIVRQTERVLSSRGWYANHMPCAYSCMLRWIGLIKIRFWAFLTKVRPLMDRRRMTSSGMQFVTKINRRGRRVARDGTQPDVMICACLHLVLRARVYVAGWKQWPAGAQRCRNADDFYAAIGRVDGTYVTGRWRL